MRRAPVPGVIAAAQSDLADAQQAWIRHKANCGQCSAAARVDQLARTCDTGWAILKRERRLAAQLHATEIDHALKAPVQLAMF